MSIELWNLCKCRVIGWDEALTRQQDLAGSVIMQQNRGISNFVRVGTAAEEVAAECT